MTDVRVKKIQTPRKSRKRYLPKSSRDHTVYLSKSTNSERQQRKKAIKDYDNLVENFRKLVEIRNM